MRRLAAILLFLYGPLAPLEAKTWLLTFTGFGNSPSGDTCGRGGVFPADTDDPAGMLQILRRLAPLRPETALESRAFTFFNEGMGLACRAPLDGEADHVAAAEFLRGRIAPQDRVIVAGHSYGGHRALLFSQQFERDFGRPVTALVLADPIDWTECSIQGLLNGNRTFCRQQGYTLNLPDTALSPRSVWVFRQQRGYRLGNLVLPILTGYRVTINGVAARDAVLPVTHAEVDRSFAVQSTLTLLALDGSITVENSAEEAGESSSQ